MELKLYYLPGNNISRKFFEILSPIYHKLQHRVNFSPHIVSFSYKSEEYSVDNCLSKGKYCAFPGIRDEFTGQNILMEGLRQKCVYKASVSNYFIYMNYFYKNCRTSMKFDCSKKVISSYTSLDPIDIFKCVVKSFHSVEDDLYSNDNDLLSSDQQELQEIQTNNFPNFFINGVLYEGTLSKNDLLLALCSSLHDEEKSCTELSMEDEDFLNETHIVVIHIFIFFFLILIMIYICKEIAKQKHKEEFQKQVNKFIGQYNIIKDHNA